MLRTTTTQERRRPGPAAGPLLRAGALFAVAVVLAFATGCSRAPADPIAALLAAIERAAEARDAEAVAAHLSPDFAAAHGMSRADTLLQLKRWFAVYESIAIDLGDVETTREAATARVRCVAEFRGRAKKVFGLDALLPPEAVYRFELELRQEAEAWLVRSASWEPTGEGSPPAQQ